MIFHQEIACNEFMRRIKGLSQLGSDMRVFCGTDAVDVSDVDYLVQSVVNWTPTQQAWLASDNRIIILDSDYGTGKKWLGSIHIIHNQTGFFNPPMQSSEIIDDPQNNHQV